MFNGRWEIMDNDDFTSLINIIASKLLNEISKSGLEISKIILCGRGRKNKTLIDRIKKVDDKIVPVNLTKVFAEIGKVRELIAMLPEPANLQPLLDSLQALEEYGWELEEDIENSSPAQAEAVKATGASWFQWINYAIQPQVMPRMIGLSVYRLDINFRESAVVGIVGGGGIGATLNTAFSRYEFDTAAAILLVIIGIVMVLEYASSHLRKWVQ